MTKTAVDTADPDRLNARAVARLLDLRVDELDALVDHEGLISAWRHGLWIRVHRIGDDSYQRLS